MPSKLALTLGSLDDLPTPTVPYEDGTEIEFVAEIPAGSFPVLEFSTIYELEAVLLTYMTPDSKKEWAKRRKAANKTQPEGAPTEVLPMSQARLYAAVAAVLRHHYPALLAGDDPETPEETVGKSVDSSD